MKYLKISYSIPIFLVILFYQNCGNINLKNNQNEEPVSTPLVPVPIDQPTLNESINPYLNLEYSDRSQTITEVDSHHTLHGAAPGVYSFKIENDRLFSSRGTLGRIIVFEIYYPTNVSLTEKPGQFFKDEFVVRNETCQFFLGPGMHVDIFAYKKTVSDADRKGNSRCYLPDLPEGQKFWYLNIEVLEQAPENNAFRITLPPLPKNN